MKLKDWIIVFMENNRADAQYAAENGDCRKEVCIITDVKNVRL